MILPDHEIKARCQSTRRVPDLTAATMGAFPSMREIEQEPMVQPFIEENLQPASLDVRLGNYFKVFEREASSEVDMADPVDITKTVRVEPDGFFTLHPGEFVLGATIEKLVVPDDLVARIEGKSSLGRLGLIVHATAGYIDPGFRGPITLEMTCLHPLAIKLRPGMLIGQFSFQQMTSPASKPYSGRYQGAIGVESSKYGASRSQVELERMRRAVEDTSLDQPTRSEEIEANMSGGLLHCDCTCHQPIGPGAYDTGVNSCEHCELIG